MTVFNQQQVKQQEKLAEESEEKKINELISKHAYWDTHTYYRMSVTDDITKFCGWKSIVELVNFRYNSELETAFLSALFLSGGRIKEVLNLTKENFTLCARPDGEKYLRVDNMTLEKRYKKIGKKYVDEEGNNRFHTKKEFAFRGQFSIMLKEPIADFLFKWINKSKGGLLFPSSFHRKGEKRGIMPRSRHWAYRFTIRLSKAIPSSLVTALGLGMPQIVDRTEENPNGRIKAKNLHLWLHWFRSMRASQLRHDYHWDIYELMNYFSWKDVKIAKRYIHEGAEDMAASMNVKSYE